MGKKTELVELGKYLSTEKFKNYLKKTDGDFDLLRYNVEIVGLKEEDESFRLLYRLPGLDDVYCELLVNKASNKVSTKLYKKIDD